jgi:hypothetical protein
MISPEDLPKLADEHLSSKAEQLCAKIDNKLIESYDSIITPDNSIYFEFEFFPNTSSRLISKVRDTYTAGGWNATVNYVSRVTSPAKSDQPEFKLCLSKSPRVILPSKTPKVLNIVEFAYSVGLTLSDWQRHFIITAYRGRQHNQDLSFTDDDIKQIITDEGPLNGKFGGVEWDTKFAILGQAQRNTPPSHTTLVSGRRSGRTMLTALVAAYEAYVTMNTNGRNYPLMNGDPIVISIIVCNHQLAEHAKNQVIDLGFYANYFPGAQISRLNITIPADHVMNYSGHPIQIRPSYFTEQVLQSRLPKALILDMPSLWNANEDQIRRGLGHAATGAAMFGTDALRMTFENNIEAYDDGKIGNVLLRIPTWLMNPNIEPEFFERQFNEDASNFWRNFGVRSHFMPRYRKN